MKRVGRYEITELIGQGGMGTVYKAFDPLLARVVAIKVISAQFHAQPELPTPGTQSPAGPTRS